MSIHCITCARVCSNERVLLAHDCRTTTRRQTENSTTRVSHEQWAEIERMQARSAHPSSYVPDGAA